MNKGRGVRFQSVLTGKEVTFKQSLFRELFGLKFQCFVQKLVERFTVKMLVLIVTLATLGCNSGSSAQVAEPSKQEQPGIEQPSIAERAGKFLLKKAMDSVTEDKPVAETPVSSEPPQTPAPQAPVAEAPSEAKTSEEQAPEESVENAAAPPAVSNPPPSSIVTAATPAGDGRFMNWVLRYFDFSEVSWWWILLGWLVVSALVTSVTEGYWKQDIGYWDNDTQIWIQESSTRRYSALNRRRAPGWGGAIFSGVVAFLVWANYDSVGSLVPTLSKVGILLVGYIVVATTCWSLTLRWSLFCREEYDEPYNVEAARSLAFRISTRLVSSGPRIGSSKR